MTLTQKHASGPVNLIADWTAGEDTPRYVTLDQRADHQAWRRGRKRFWIEPSFRDWKSYGFLSGVHDATSLQCYRGARQLFPDRIRSRVAGRETIIQRNRRPIAVIIGYEQYQKLLALRQGAQEREERLVIYDEIRARNADALPEQVEADVAEAVRTVRASH